MSKIAIVAAALGTFVAASASAQTRTGAVVSGSVGVLSMDSGTHAAVSGSIGYKLNSALSFGIELTGVPEMESDLDLPVPLVAPSILPRYSDVEGSATIFTTNVRVDIPTIASRILPFVAGGGGVANLKESYVISVLPASLTTVYTELTGTGLSRPFPSPILYPPYPYPVTRSTTGMALTIGGGLSILATDRFSIDVDLRYFRIMSEVDRNAGRFGAGASYRF